MAPVIKLLQENPSILCTLITTGQHQEMIAQVMNDFNLIPDDCLVLKRSTRSLADLSAQLFTQVDRVFDKYNFDWVLVQGDTTSAMTVGLCAFYRRVKIAHIEAGLRSNNVANPFPEELNRRVLGIISNRHFPPTDLAKRNLINEGVETDNAIVTGNTVVDSLLMLSRLSTRQDLPEQIQAFLERYPKYILITGHRRENIGVPLNEICVGIKRLANVYRQVGFLYPMHLNPDVRDPVQNALAGSDNIMLTEPLGYKGLIQIMKTCLFVITDSGGIQEEAPTFGKPVLVTRKTTERPEGLTEGCTKLIGTCSDSIFHEASRLISDTHFYASMTAKRNPFGDGLASKRIIQSLLSA